MTSSCSDSPLSITGNLISVLTFGLGIAASYLAFYTLTRDALSEIETFKRDLDIARTPLRSIFECCATESCLAPTQTNNREGALEKSISALEMTLESLYDELDGLQKKHQNTGNGWWTRTELGKRLRWVYKRKQIVQRMTRIVAEKMEVHVSQMSLLLR
jgi:hypothetical protein